MDTKLKPADVENVLSMASLLHRRYETFVPALHEALSTAEKQATPKSLRMILRLRAELFLTGIMPEPGPLAKLVRRLCAGRRDDNGVPSPAFYAGAITHFLKCCSHHVVGAVPASLAAAGVGTDAPALLPERARDTITNALTSWFDAVCKQVCVCDCGHRPCDQAPL